MPEPSFEILRSLDPFVIDDGVSLSFAVIPPVPEQEAALRDGKPLSFRMGSRGIREEEEPQHEVIISRPFYLGTVPVTQRQFACWKKDHENHFKGRPDHPAESMNWHEANDFCKWVNEMCRDQLPPQLEVCLPTEAQWEYACRAGTNTDYWNGDGGAALRKVAWFGEEWHNGSTHPVEQLPANPWGLYDTHGNVHEWCFDGWDEDAYKKRGAGCIDPFSQGRENGRVVRGGAWIGSMCRSSQRSKEHPDNPTRPNPGLHHVSIGFRLCLSSGSVGEPAARNP